MGAGFSQVFPCFNPAAGPNRSEPDVNFDGNAPLDETLGHSFCYVRSSARFVSPTLSDRFVSPSQSLRFDDPAHPRPFKTPSFQETGFRAISGASVSANTSTPVTVLQLDVICNDATTPAANQHHHNDNTNSSSSNKGFVAVLSKGGCNNVLLDGFSKGGCNNVLLDGFESTSSFSAIPLQRVPRGGEPPSGPVERAFFMSGPIERGALSGPLDGASSGDNSGGVPFSAPLGGIYVKKRKKSISGMRKALYRNFSVVPVRNFISRGERKDVLVGDDVYREVGCESNVQWALGKAGEDRVHVVVSEELGWLFVGIYDGFNGPDAPEFLMSHLYKAMYNELEGLFWDSEDVVAASENAHGAGSPSDANGKGGQELEEQKDGDMESQVVEKMIFEGEQIDVRRRRLWEFLMEDDPEEGLDLSGSEIFPFSVDDASCVNNVGSAVSRRSLLLSKLKHGLLIRHKDKESSRFFPWRFWLDEKQNKVEEMRENNVADDGEVERETISGIGRKRKVGLVDHELVLSAMSRALEVTEQAYLDMTDRVLDRYPELALMGSCLLVVLMKDEDVYVMNVGDSRAIVAQYKSQELRCDTEPQGPEDAGFNGEGIMEESAGVADSASRPVNEAHAHHCISINALQLSTDHNTSIEEFAKGLK
ncbi:hypothetical protein OROMI_009248 [Orobanche minor]